MSRCVRITVFLAALFLAQAPGSSRAGLLTVGTSGGSSQSTDLTDTLIRQDVLDFPSAGWLSTLKGRSSVASLGLNVDARSSSNFAVPGSVNTAFDADVIFAAAPGVTTATIGWSARIQGTVDAFVFDTVFEPGWQLGAQLSMNPNNPVTVQLAMTESFEKGSSPVAIDTVITALGEVPTNVPVRISASLNFNAVQVRNGDNLNANFFNSMSFDPAAFFDIHTAGVTANSVAGDGDWLVDNQLTTVESAVPEPSSMALLGMGALGLCGLRRWGRQRQASTVA